MADCSHSTCSRSSVPDGDGGGEDGLTDGRLNLLVMMLSSLSRSRVTVKPRKWKDLRWDRTGCSKQT